MNQRKFKKQNKEFWEEINKDINRDIYLSVFFKRELNHASKNNHKKAFKK